MIGSIGAESRYSTGYNNLKPNWNQNKWADTLAQTVDKEDISSRADINRAKKSTVMDSYLALSGKTINTLKQEYSEYESENYRIVPDNEAECFDIYNKDGERLGAFSYSDIKIRQDETTGKQFLISEHGTMSYDALVLDDELKDALQNVMDKDSLDVETLQGYTLNTHSGTGIQYLVKDGEEGRGGKVLLQNEADRKRYEELAEMYFDKYPNLSLIKEEIENKKVAFIPTASLREGYTGYVGSARKLFKKLGAIVTEIDISTEAYSTIQSVFEDADVIYFTGGNSFFLMDWLRKTGTDGLLKKELANGKLMIGESAGAIICAPSIQYIQQMDEKPEDYSQEDDAGLDLIDFYVLPHYLTAPFKKVTEKIMTEFSDLNLCPINNHQGIVIDGEGSKVICKD